jgi:hypothetical protein
MSAPAAAAAAAAAAAPPFKFGAPIPSLLWESVEDAMRTNMRLLAKDIAATLGQSEAPLLEALKKETVRPYLFEESDQSKELDMRCDYLCQRADAPLVVKQCGQPVFWNATTAGVHRCTEHLYSKNIHRPTVLEKWWAIDYKDEEGVLPTPLTLFRNKQGEVFSGDGVLRGRYCRGSKRLVLFKEVD